MASVKPLLDKRRKKADNTFPIVVRVTHNRHSRNISTGYSIEAKYWNEGKGAVKSSNLNSTTINSIIYDISARITKLIKELTEKERFTLATLLDYYNGKQLPENTTILTHGQSIVLDLIEMGNVGNAKVYETALNQFENCRISDENISCTNVCAQNREML